MTEDKYCDCGYFQSDCECCIIGMVCPVCNKEAYNYKKKEMMKYV